MTRAGWIASLSAGAAAFGVLLLTRRASGAQSGGPRRVALIGDSYAVGLGPKLEALIPGLRYEGHVGSNTAQWSAGQFGASLAGLEPDVVLVSLGVNDGATPNPANYQAIVQRLRSAGAEVIWIEPPLAVNTPAVRNVIASLGVKTVPARLMPMAADGLHPQNYAPWAAAIASELSRE